jgi:hypothetical protein
MHRSFARDASHVFRELRARLGRTEESPRLLARRSMTFTRLIAIPQDEIRRRTDYGLSSLPFFASATEPKRAPHHHVAAAGLRGLSSLSRLLHSVLPAEVALPGGFRPGSDCGGKSGCSGASGNSAGAPIGADCVAPLRVAGRRFEEARINGLSDRSCPAVVAEWEAAGS